MRKTKSIDDYWSKYDKAVAHSHLLNYGTIYIDEFGVPIDNEFETDELYLNDNGDNCEKG